MLINKLIYINLESMQKNQLNNEDFKLIIESLENSRYKFKNYEGFPSHEYKQKRISEVNDTLNKVKSILKKEKR